MTRVVYVNGRYLPYAQAGVHAEDRGFQFADAVYEVCEVKDGRLVDETRHMAAAGALARRAAASAQPMTRGRLVPRAARNHPAQPACATASSICRSRAAPARASSCSRPADVDADASCASRAASRRPQPKRAPRRASRVKTMPDMRWAALRHQDGDAAAGGLAKEAARKRRRQGGLVRRRRGLRHRRRVDQRLDRRQRGPADHAARSIPPFCAGVTRRTLIDLLEARGHRARRAAVYRRGGQGGARGFHHVCDQYRHAGRAHRRAADRQWRAGAADAKAERRISSPWRKFAPT